MIGLATQSAPRAAMAVADRGGRAVFRECLPPAPAELARMQVTQIAR